MSVCCVCGRIADQLSSYHCAIGNDIYHYCSLHEGLGKSVQKKGKKNMDETKEFLNRIARGEDTNSNDVKIPDTFDDAIRIISNPTTTLSMPKVFLFKANDLCVEKACKMQEVLKREIEEGCVVVPDCVDYIGVEDLYKHIMYHG